VRRLLALVGVLAMFAAAACSGDSKPDAAPAATTALPETTVPVPTTTPTTLRPTTTSSTAKPTTTQTTLLGFGPGGASLVGTVIGPGGPVVGATVHIERLVGKNVATMDVTTAGGGAWQLTNILGGSYRVRAYKPPDFGQSQIESFFLAATDRKTLDLKVPTATGPKIIATVTPNPPRVDQPATLTIQVGTGRVDDQGRPAITPRPGVPLVLTPGAGIVLDSANQAVTDGNGKASWGIRCTAEGARAVTLTIDNGTTTVNLPACGPAVPTPAPGTTKPA